MRRAATGLLLVLAACKQAPPAAESAIGEQRVVPPAVRGTPEGTLARYVGKYPGDLVDGTSFLADPLVTAGVRQVVDDPVVAKLVLGNAVASPVIFRDGQLIANGCEPHNCGGHNWAILIRPDGRQPQVCHKPDAGAPRWYGPTPVGAAKDVCPQG